MMTEKEKQRIELAVSCQDCENLPKHCDAGKVTQSGDGDYQVMHNGIRTYTDTHYGPYNVEVINRLRGHHEPQEEIVFQKVLEHIPSNGVMLELGSFWAYYSLWFLHEVKAGRAILVEPISTALEAGRRNFKLNNREGVFVTAAVGAAVAPEAPVELWPGTTVCVRRTTVDSLMSVHNLSRLNILHADIQGAEVSMLLGSAYALRHKAIDWIFISTHGENIHQRCLQVLRRFGYFVHVEHTPSESFTVDGLIVAGTQRKRLAVAVSKRQSWRGLKARLRATVRVRLLERIGLKPITV